MYCVQRLQSIHIHQYNKLQIYSNMEWQLVSLPLTTQPTMPINCQLFSSCVRSLMQWNCWNFFVFLQFHWTHNCPLFCIQMIEMYISFQMQCLFLHIFLPHFIIKTYYKMHTVYAWHFQCKFQRMMPQHPISTQFNHILWTF